MSNGAGEGRRTLPTVAAAPYTWGVHWEEGPLAERTHLVLGGGGMVGSEVAHRIANDLRPERIVLAALTDEEVERAVTVLRQEAPEGVEVVGESGDLFDPGEEAEASRLTRMITRHRPEVIVDAVNTATAMAYRTEPAAALPRLIRHVLTLDGAMRAVGTRLYLKVGTTGTGGMGLTVPYTHSEERPSTRLLTKTAFAFAHTGLLFLMSRTPGGPIVKEVKPGALIGYREVEYRTIRRDGATVHLCSSVRRPLGPRLDLRLDPTRFEPSGGLQLPVVDTGENGVFAKGEFEAITELGQMELVTPEEVAAVCIDEIRGVGTGRDVIAAVEGAVLAPSYRGGMLRTTVIEQLETLELSTGTHSVAIGQLGPPQLCKLLWEAELLGLAAPTMPAALHLTPRGLSDAVAAVLEAEPRLADTICSLGIPILEADGETLRRGPVIRVPAAESEAPVTITPAGRDRWADGGWVDLRPENMSRWQDRLRAILEGRPGKSRTGSAGMAIGVDESEAIRPGTVVAWVLAHELGGRRVR